MAAWENHGASRWSTHISQDDGPHGVRPSAHGDGDECAGETRGRCHRAQRACRVHAARLFTEFFLRNLLLEQNVDALARLCKRKCTANDFGRRRGRNRDAHAARARLLPLAVVRALGRLWAEGRGAVNTCAGLVL